MYTCNVWHFAKRNILPLAVFVLLQSLTAVLVSQVQIYRILCNVFVLIMADHKINMITLNSYEVWLPAASACSYKNPNILENGCIILQSAKSVKNASKHCYRF